jgi:hypothetical protein
MALMLLTALGSMEAPCEPSVLMICPPSPTNLLSARELVNFSEHGRKVIAELSGHVVYGTEEDAAAFLQTPGNGPATNRGSHLVVIDPKTSAILADENVSGFTPGYFKAITVNKMAVRPKEFTVYVSTFENREFNVEEVNWKTGVAHRLPLPVPGMARHWEITSLFTIPYGIGVARGPMLTLFDTTTQTPGSVLTLPHGPDERPAHKSGFLPVPGFGLMQISQGMFARVTDKDFLTPFPTPVEFPSSEIQRNGRTMARTIDGRPCLVWAENPAQVFAPGSIPTELVVFDLESQKEILRKRFEITLPCAFQPDWAGSHVYFIDSKKGEVLCLNLKTQEITPFAETGIENLNDASFALVAAN